ncbi:MAG TPA: ABC transporter ATP-binding protein [Caulobacteraceae bacterium]|nr:ABC transporter ATP-binding protein [Caulobacteraceae bacterium]
MARSRTSKCWPRAKAPLIELRAVSRIFQVGEEQILALDGVSLTIEQGELVAIVGASGSGKSTLMAVLGCLDRPSSGQYLFEGRPVEALQDAELAHLRNAAMGFVFQSFNLLPRTSALDNVSLPLIYAEPPIEAEERIARARAALEQMGLGAQLTRTPSRLSGGQQQRVAIARALVNRPRVILADEPTGNLDTATSRAIMDQLRALNRQSGITIVLVTHESDIAGYADRVITMRDGRIAEDRKASTGWTAAA